ncbi:MAG: Uma2 family endonuclease [Flammeovirgaceae bacterium]|nr:Uma2 family endonuclease [Flammeovirgaceae bacterium]
MKPLLETPPRTIMEVYKSLPEGTLAELIDNTIYMSPSPISKHQLILNEINFQLLQFLKKDNKGVVFIAPFDVYLDETSNAVQPDIVVVLKNNEKIIDPNGHIHGIPDLLVEILSPGNKDYDLIKKKDLYEKFGVEEYWIVDPDTKLALCYELRNKKYAKSGEEIGFIKSPLLKLEVRF